MIDTHAHMHDRAFDDDRDEAIARMRAAGVSHAVTVGCDLADSARALEAASRYDLFASVGIHPHEAKDAPADIAAAFAPLLEDARVVAVGETGLDYYYHHSPPPEQQRALREQIRIARKHKLPVIFHHRDAFEDFCAILREEWDGTLRGVVHCFTGNAAQARTYVEEFGFYLGIGGIITFKNADKLREAVRSVGAERLVLETDSPYLAPVPERGKRNEPAFIVHSAQRLAGVLGLPLDKVLGASDRNARDLFALPS